MQTLRTAAEAAQAARRLARPLALVPTMGALHAGHIALIEAARSGAASVMATIFVNPLQFGPTEDFSRYPRSFAEDERRLAAAGVDLLFAPSVEEMYPPGFDTNIDPGAIATRYEGALRPGHFRGVATVCAKLFAIAGAERAYFGAKDAQQVAVLRQIVRDLALPVEIVGRADRARSRRPRALEPQRVLAPARTGGRAGALPRAAGDGRCGYARRNQPRPDRRRRPRRRSPVRCAKPTSTSSIRRRSSRCTTSAHARGRLR